MSQIIIYGTANCPKCQALKHALDNENLAYTYVDVRKDIEAAATLELLGYDLLPVISKGGNFFSDTSLKKQIQFAMEV